MVEKMVIEFQNLYKVQYIYYLILSYVRYVILLSSTIMVKKLG